MTHFGVIPNTNLLASVGADLHWDDSQHCWRPVRADGFRTTVPGIYAVGDGQGIFGARSAALSGALAVRQCLREFHWLDSVDEARDRQLMRDYQDDARVRPFLETLFLPPFDQLLTLDDEVVVCRCEEVTVAELKQACEAGARGVNQLKTYTRCGMGPARAVSAVMRSACYRPDGWESPSVRSVTTTPVHPWCLSPSESWATFRATGLLQTLRELNMSGINWLTLAVIGGFLPPCCSSAICLPKR
ncbi:(2Fe-2S)-binding protein [Oceanimonas sp. NS1]|nr:(2Fe-2S)-binding protein [Oceanimonas sp. NS1]